MKRLISADVSEILMEESFFRKILLRENHGSARLQMQRLRPRLVPI